MWKRLCLESSTCNCKNGKYLANTMDDSVITCDEIIDAETKTVPTNFSKKMQPVKQMPCLFINYYYIIDSC